MRKFLAAAIALHFALIPTFAQAQAVQQSGAVTPNSSPIWNGTGVIKGGNTATDSPLTTFGVTRDGVDGICVSSGRATAVGRNQLCLQASTTGPAKISLQNYGTATAQDLQFVINGIAVTLPSGGGTFITGTPPYTVGHAACFNTTSGVIQDCGVSVGAGTQWGIPYYSTTSTLTSSAAGTNGQFFLGQTGAAPAWTTLNGDVASVSAAGAVTLQKVNGIPFPFTFTAHAVLLGNGTSQFGTSITSNVGQCFISQGLNADPIWAACASGSGSAGGANTQVQFNNSTALAGSANLTWVSPTLTIGVAAGGTGSLALAGSTSGTVMIQPQNVAGTYNFNLPTSAGTTGQPLISAGGIASPMTFGTLGIIGGGTNCAAASGTCLDNITGFTSVGYIRRAGAGSYTQVTPIPVSDGGTNLAAGTSGGVLAYTGTGTLTSSGLLTQNGVVLGGGAGAVPTSTAAGTNGQLLLGQTSAAPTWNTVSGDIASISAAGVITIANSAVTLAKQANGAAYSLQGNFTASSAAPQFSTIGALTQKSSPASTDLVLIQDQAASGQLKFATVSSIAAAGSVASIGGNTGAFTLTQPISNIVNAIILNATITPQMRVTLVTGTPVMATSQSAVATVFVTPYNGNLVPIYDGTNFVPTAFAEVSQATTDATKSPAAASTNLNYDIFCWVDTGPTNRCTRGPPWTTGGGSANARGTGAGSTALTLVNGIYLNSVSITNGPAASRGTYVGTICTNGSSTVDYIFGAAASGGTAGRFCVWNAFNREMVTTSVQDTTDTWSSSGVSLTWRAANNSATARVSFVQGLVNTTFWAQYNSTGNAGASTAQLVGVGLNTTTGYCGTTQANASVGVSSFAGTCQGYALLGFNFVSANEATSNTTISTYYGDLGIPSVMQTGLNVQLWQ